MGSLHVRVVADFSSAEETTVILERKPLLMWIMINSRVAVVGGLAGRNSGAEGRREKKPSTPRSRLTSLSSRLAKSLLVTSMLITC